MRVETADFHVVRGLVEYKVAIGRKEEIEIGARCIRFGRSSVTFHTAIFPKDGETLLATGEIVWVLTDKATRRPIPIPAPMREALGAFEGMDFS